jgi:hypothetical protein
MTYVNYEVLTQALATNLIDFSQADIYELQNQTMTEQELEDFLAIHNEYTSVSWLHRLEQIRVLQETIQSFSKIGKKEKKIKKRI